MFPENSLTFFVVESGCVPYLSCSPKGPSVLTSSEDSQPKKKIAAKGHCLLHSQVLELSRAYASPIDPEFTNKVQRLAIDVPGYNLPDPV